MQILFLQTGGTIDKAYPANDDNHGYNFEIDEPAFDRILNRINPSFAFETKTILLKDSTDITDEDRQLILHACRGCPQQKIIITHGSDTMVKTAELLSGIEGKTIVLTGAMSPEVFKNSDADFNLGVAVGAVVSIEAGVYIAMNGQVLPWNKVKFNDQTRQFIEI